MRMSNGKEWMMICIFRYRECMQEMLYVKPFTAACFLGWWPGLMTVLRLPQEWGQRSWVSLTFTDLKCLRSVSYGFWSNLWLYLHIILHVWLECNEFIVSRMVMWNLYIFVAKQLWTIHHQLLQWKAPTDFYRTDPEGGTGGIHQGGVLFLC